MNCDDAAAETLAAALKISPVVAKLLCQRGLSDPELADRFLNPSLDHLHDPMLLKDMGVAVERILAAIARKEKIAIHGDYDVDGVTSTVILRRALELLGADVTHFIPERLKDGYGLQPVAIERLHADGVALVISVDCGIRGAEAGRRARELGVDLIITDHHEPDAELPPALAVINPKRADCTYPDKYLAGVGVALKLVQALCRRTGRDKLMPGFIKVAAIGTLADVVPLVGENRVIAKLGLDLLTKGPHKVGLRALIDVCGLTGKTIDSYHIGFMLAPRVNAAGRMSTPDIAARLFLADDEALAEEVRQLALQLDSENVKRQEEEAEILAQAKKIVTTDPEVGARSILVVAGEGWHRGVIGIVASKLQDAFHRPAIVLSVEDGIAHGSCRSFSRFDMLGALERCAHLMTRFGGHKQAAGLTMDASPDSRAASCRQRRRRRNAGPRRSDAASAHRRRPCVPRDYRRRRRRHHVAGAVRGRQPAPGVRGARRRDHRRPAQAEGAPPEDVAQAGRANLPRRGVARRRAPRLPQRAQGGARCGVLARTEPVQWQHLRRAHPRRLEELRFIAT